MAGRDGFMTQNQRVTKLRRIWEHTSMHDSLYEDIAELYADAKHRQPVDMMKVFCKGAFVSVCGFCGNELREQAKYCDLCGRELIRYDVRK